MSKVRIGSHSGLASDTSSYPARYGAGRPGGGVSPPTTQGGPDLLGILLKTLIEAPVPGSEVTGRGIKSDQPPDSLFSLPRVVCNCDPGGR